MKMEFFRSVHANETALQPEAVSSKKEIGHFLMSCGFSPTEFLFYYLYEDNAEIRLADGTALRRCYYDELPEDLECFFCHAKGKSLIYDYHRHRDPRISKRGIGGV